MGTPYVGEIRMFGGSFAPAGWMFCSGQTLPISENETLFNLIGTTYGGDGQETFQLPDLQGRVPIHMGTGSSGTSYQQGEKAGTESVTISTQQLPIHGHPLLASADTGDQISPGNDVPAACYNVTPFINDQPGANFNAQAVQPIGGSQPHENMQPFLCVSFIISLFGVFPSQT